MKQATIVRASVLLIATAGVMFPLYFMVVTSLKSESEYTGDKLGLPSVTFENIRSVAENPDLIRWLVNSLVITGASVALAIICAVFAAYAIARSETRRINSVLLVLIALMAVPPVVLVVPLFVMMARLDLLNTRVSVIIIYAGLLIPLSIFLLVGFFRGIPKELDEAGFLDGASRLAILRFVMLPLAKPAILTLAVVNAVYVWNEFLIALLFLQRESAQTLMVGITSFQGRFETNEPLLMAWSLFASVPVVLLYVFGQRFLVRGLTGGALK